MYNIYIILREIGLKSLNHQKIAPFSSLNFDFSIAYTFVFV